MKNLLFAALALSMGTAQAAQCTAKSDGKTVALVELYTSEGCDSCPPADRWLSSMGPKGFAPDRVVPIALHVDYWDYIGWKDPYARQAHSARQRKMAKLARAAMVYTPQGLLQGQDFRSWRDGGNPDGAFSRTVAEINARPAKARISLSLDTGRKEALGVEVTAELLAPAPGADIALFLGAYENKLVSELKAGENRGRTLPHDYVVLQWAGPFEFQAGKLSDRHLLAL